MYVREHAHVRLKYNVCVNILHVRILTGRYAINKASIKQKSTACGIRIRPKYDLS